MAAFRIVVLLVGGLELGGCFVEGSANARPGYGGAYVQSSQPGYVSGTAGPAQPVYGQPAQPVYGQPAQPVYAQPGRPACGQCIPGSPEVCDGCDNNCNGVIDEGC